MRPNYVFLPIEVCFDHQEEENVIISLVELMPVTLALLGNNLVMALAFGVVSGATASSVLVTAVLAGFIMGALSGAPFQISGPTGAIARSSVVIKSGG